MRQNTKIVLRYLGHMRYGFLKFIFKLVCLKLLLPTENPPTPAGTAAPGQTNAHQQPTIHDPMTNMKIAFGVDQLTRVRFAGEKDLLSGSHIPSDSFEYCSPFKPVMRHNLPTQT